MKRPLNVHTVEIQTNSYWVDDDGKLVDSVGPRAYQMKYIAKASITPAALIAKLQKIYKFYEERKLPKNSPVYDGATTQVVFYKLTHISVKQNKKMLWDYVIDEMNSNGGWWEYYSDQEMN